MFRSRRPVAPPPETAKVAQVVQAYYDAGKRPASHLSPSPAAPVEVEVPDAALDPAPQATLDHEPFVAREQFITSPEPFTAMPLSEPEPAPVAADRPITAGVAAAAPAEDASPVHKTLAELAEELESFIEVIRYGDDLGSSTARS
jgi:hypothetical protein